MNSINLLGRLGRDPEVKYLESGQVVATGSIAVRKWGKDEAPDWFNLEVWGKQAQLLADYVRKGDQIAVQGRITSETYRTREGEERKKWLVKVSNLSLVETKGERPAKPAAGGSAGWDEEPPF